MPNVIIYADKITSHQSEWEVMLRQIIGTNKHKLTLITPDRNTLAASIDETGLRRQLSQQIQYIESKEAFCKEHIKQAVGEYKEAFPQVIVMAPKSAVITAAEEAGEITRHVEKNDFLKMKAVCSHYAMKSNSPEFEDIQTLYFRLVTDLAQYNSCISAFIAKESLEAQIAFLQKIIQLADNGCGSKLQCVKTAKEQFETPDIADKVKFRYSDVAVTFFCHSTETGALVDKILETPSPKVM